MPREVLGSPWVASGGLSDAFGRPFVALGNSLDGFGYALGRPLGALGNPKNIQLRMMYFGAFRDPAGDFGLR